MLTNIDTEVLEQALELFKFREILDLPTVKAIKAHAVEWKLRAALAAQPTAPVVPQLAWISVNDKLPPFMIPVITTNGNIVTQTYRTAKDSWAAYGINDHVTHWMPLPAAPLSAAPERDVKEPRG